MQESSANPRYLKRLGGIALTILGTIGAVITSPLALIGGTIGVINGLRNNRDFIDAGLEGAYIGSLGTYTVMLTGVDLTRHVREPAKKIESLLAVKNDTQTAVTPTTPARQPMHALGRTQSTPVNRVPLIATVTSTTKSTPSYSFNKPDDLKSFLDLVNAVIVEAESRVQLDAEAESQINDAELIRLTALIKNVSTLDGQFCSEVKNFSGKDFQLFVSKLGIRKDAKNSRCELDHLWQHFRGENYGLTLAEKKGSIFSKIIRSLSEEQLRVTFDSPDFLSILKMDLFAKSLSNALKREQWQLFAEKRSRHPILIRMIAKLSANEFMLGKLFAILPHASEVIGPSLIKQFAAIPNCKSNFKIDLTRLTDHYIAENKAKLEAEPQLQAATLRRESSKRWPTVQSNTSPVYPSPNGEGVQAPGL